MNLPSTILIYTTGALAAWWNMPRPAQLPPIVIEKNVTEDKVVYIGVTTIPPGEGKPRKKLFTA